MAALTFADSHNMVAYLEKSKDNADFAEIVGDFLNASPIRYALTVSLTVYVSYIEQFWSIAKIKTVNNETQIRAKVDGKTIVITESSVRRDLHFDDEDGITCLTNTDIFENLQLMGNLDPNSKKFLMYPRFLQLFLNNQIENLASVFNDEYDTPSHIKKAFANMRRQGKDFSGTVTPLFPSKLASQAVEGEGSGQPTEPQHTPTTDSLSHVEPIPTIASSSHPKKTHKHDAVHEERGDCVERAATPATSGSPRCQEAMGDTIAQTRSERVSTPSYDSPLLGVNTPRNDEERIKLKELMDMWVLDLENVKDAQALEIKKLKKRVKKLEKKRKSRTPQLKRRLFKFQEDLETQGRYGHDTEINTASTSITTTSINITTVEPVITVSAPVATAGVSTLMKMRSVKSKENPKEKGVSSETATRLTRGVIMKEASETATRPIVPPQQQLDLKDKGKGIMQEPEKLVKVKGKHQIEYDADVAQRLQAELDEEMSVEERSRLLMEFIAARKKFFAAKRVEKQRNKPPTKAEQKKKISKVKTILDICPRVEGVDFMNIPDDDTALTFSLILALRTEAIHTTYSYQMFIKILLLARFAPKKSRGKGSQGNKTVDDSQETIDVSEDSKPEPGPATKKTSSKRRVKNKVTLSADDNIISDDPNAALELAKSISQIEAKEAEAVRKVYATHARVVTESAKKKSGGRSSKSVVIQYTPSAPKSKPATSKSKLKGAPSLTPVEQEAANIMQALKESNKTSRRQPGTGGSNERTSSKPEVPDESTIVYVISSEGTGIKPGVPDEEKDITEEKVILEWGDEQDSEYSDDDNDDVEKDDKDGDADDEGNNHISDTQDADYEDAKTKSDGDDIYKYKIRVRKDEDEEILMTEVDGYLDKGDEKITDAAKEDAEKTSEAKDDAKKTELPPLSLSLFESLGFGDQFLKLSFDSSLVSTVKDTTYIEINSLLEVKIQSEVPHTQSPSMLSVHVFVIFEPIVPTPVHESPSTATTTTLPPLFVSTTPFVPQQTTTPIPTATITIDALTVTTAVPESNALTTSQVPSVVDNYLGYKVGDVFKKELKKHTTDLIQKYSLQQFSKSSKKQTPTVDLEQGSEKTASEILQIKREQAKKQHKPKFTIKSIDKAALEEYDLKSALYQSMHANKSFNRNPANH
ncbi:hypothetical protein Tco_0340797 [Tanacetum coccineum]